MSDNTSTPHGGGAAATDGLRPMPKVNRITVNDVIDAFAAGLADFRRAPIYGIAIGSVFAVGGLPDRQPITERLFGPFRPKSMSHKCIGSPEMRSMPSSGDRQNGISN